MHFGYFGLALWAFGVRCAQNARLHILGGLLFHARKLPPVFLPKQRKSVWSAEANQTLFEKMAERVGLNPCSAARNWILRYTVHL